MCSYAVRPQLTFLTGSPVFRPRVLPAPKAVLPGLLLDAILQEPTMTVDFEWQHQQPWEPRPMLTSVHNTIIIIIITTSEPKHVQTMAGMCSCSSIVVQQPYPSSQVCHRFTLPPHMASRQHSIPR